MCSRQAISVLLLLLAATYSSEAAETVTPMVNLTEPVVDEDIDCPMHLVLGPNNYDQDINATFECTAPNTTTLWGVDNYLLVDRDQFTKQGLYVLDPEQGISKLVFEAPAEKRKGGFPFVFEALDKCYFTLYCLAVEDSVNVVISYNINSSQTVATCYCTPQRPNITIVGCGGENGTSPIVQVSRPPNFNGLVELNYTITIKNMTSVKMVDNESTSNSSFSCPVDISGCGDGCEICVRAISCEGEGEEACVNVTKDQCNNEEEVVPDQPIIKCQLKCEEEEDQCNIEVEPCSIEFELKYNVSGAKNYSFCDHYGCRDLIVDDLKSVNVTVPVTSLMDYTVTLTACTDDDTCFTTTTPLGSATCTSECPGCPGCPGCDEPPWWCPWCPDYLRCIIVAAVLALLVGAIIGGTIGGVIGYCIKKCKDNRRNKTQPEGKKDKKTKARDNMELMNDPEPKS